MGHVDDDEVTGKKGDYQLYRKFGLTGTSTKNSRYLFRFLIAGSLKHASC